MKYPTSIKLVVMLFAVVAFSFLVHASKRVPRSTMPELSTAWVGWADMLHYFRLELKADGTGTCALYERSRSSSRLYEITQWTLKGYDIEITLKPIDPGAWPLTMKGRATAHSLRLDLGDGRKNGWRADDTLLERELAIESAMESAKKRMQDHKKLEPVK